MEKAVLKGKSSGKLRKLRVLGWPAGSTALESIDLREQALAGA